MCIGNFVSGNSESNSFVSTFDCWLLYKLIAVVTGDGSGSQAAVAASCRYRDLNRKGGGGGVANLTTKHQTFSMNSKVCDPSLASKYKWITLLFSSCYFIKVIENIFHVCTLSYVNMSASLGELFLKYYTLIICSVCN